MNEQQIIEDTIYRLQIIFNNDSTGHDWFHIERVLKLSVSLSKQIIELDLFVVKMGALLHDIADHKFHNGDERIGVKVAKEFLSSYIISEDRKNKIYTIIEEISYKGANVSTKMSSKEGEIVQDADRLDAIGAIGIARTFAYGGSTGRAIYNPEIKPVIHNSFQEYKTNVSPTINHFYEKLLLIKNTLNTEQAKKEAECRHKFMEIFLENFYTDWNGNI